MDAVEHLSVVERTLQDAIAWMRAPDRLGLPQIGLGRLRVLRRLEAMRDADMALPLEQRRHRLLERSEFDAICAEEGGISSPDMLLHYLDANGTVFHRPGLFADRIVLDQGWALEAIYAVFDRKKVYAVLVQDGGRFSRAKLGLLVWREHSDAEQELLLSMMVSCGICFPHRDFGGVDGENEEYIAPDLLAGRDSVAARLAALWTDDRPGEPAAMTLVQPKPNEPEWYVSYAWGDDRTDEGRDRQAAVDRLCGAAEAKGRHILRDKNVMSLGDSISAFMRRIGGGDRVFVILSDKYLRSEYCMFELNEVWRTSRQEGKAFLDRVRIYALPDVDISKPADRVKWAVHWKQEHDVLEGLAREHGYVVLGDIGGRQLMQMQRFYSQVSDILGTIADIVLPRTFEELEQYGFDDVPR
jgi:hypothetical protein